MKLFDNVTAMKEATLVAGQFVQTRAWDVDVGGADYSILTPGEYGATPDEFGDHTLANGNIAKLVNAIPSLFQLGCVTGAVDNAAALTAAIENSHRVIAGHDGVIELASAVSATLTVEKSIVGFGQARRSNIRYVNAAAVITITSPNTDFYLTIAGMGFTAVVDTSSAALEILYPFSTFENRRQVTVTSCDILGAVSGTADFNQGLVLDNVWQSTVEACTIQGNSADKTKVLKGIEVKGNSVGITITNNQVNNFQTGVSIIETSRDILITSNRLTQNIDPVIVNLSSSLDRFILADNSITGEDTGVSITNMTEVVIHGNRSSKSGASTSDYIDFKLDTVSGATVSDNVMAGAGSSGTDLGVKFIAVTNSAVHDNVLTDRPTLVTLDATTTRVAGAGNVGDVGSTTVVDSGAGNNFIEAF